MVLLLMVTMVMKTEVLCNVFIPLPTPDKSTNVLTQINQCFNPNQPTEQSEEKGTINGKKERKEKMRRRQK